MEVSFCSPKENVTVREDCGEAEPAALFLLPLGKIYYFLKFFRKQQRNLDIFWK